MLSYKLKKYLCNHICNVPYYFKFQTFYTIIDIKYINIFVFLLHIFLNFRLTYLILDEVTWWSFIVSGTAERLLGMTFSKMVMPDSWIPDISTLVFFWNRSHERLCIGYSSFISNRRVRRLLDSSTNVIWGALPMGRL